MECNHSLVYLWKLILQVLIYLFILPQDSITCHRSVRLDTMGGHKLQESEFLVGKPCGLRSGVREKSINNGAGFVFVLGSGNDFFLPLRSLPYGYFLAIPSRRNKAPIVVVAVTLFGTHIMNPPIVYVNPPSTLLWSHTLSTRSISLPHLQPLRKRRLSHTGGALSLDT